MIELPTTNPVTSIEIATGITTKILTMTPPPNATLCLDSNDEFCEFWKDKVILIR